MTTGSWPARVMMTSSRSSTTALRVSAYFARDSEYVMVFTGHLLYVQQIVRLRSGENKRPTWSLPAQRRRPSVGMLCGNGGSIMRQHIRGSAPLWLPDRKTVVEGKSVD